MEPAQDPRTIAVVGASLGGLRAVDALRRLGYAGRLVVIGAEPHMPYTRPPLTKKLLLGDGVAEHAQVALRVKPDPHDTEWVLGRDVVHCDLAARRLTLDDGTTVDFDGLVAATGVRSRRLPLEPDTASPSLPIRTLEDSVAVSERLRPDASVAIIGAGFIGCEVAAAARARGCRVAVVAVDEVPMQRPLGLQVGAELRRRHEAAGVVFHLGRGVASMAPEGGGTRLRLDDGTTLEADVVVEAVGSVPNVEWLAGNGLDLDDGVLCDGALRMGGIRACVAVGDVARFPNAILGGPPRRVEHWQIPGETAVHAAATLFADLGGAEDDGEPFGTLPTFWSDQQVASIRAFGAPGLADDVRVLEGDLAGDVAIGYLHEGALVGVVLLGLAKEQGRFLQQVQESLTLARA
ncbi:FAD/NAD(P)-binding oxidoreductase [Nocardioides endophyticus]|uniref:FAD/NAD(P)-binding oxidoreductase n=1 Tax=Nocardioides endophyticus TaxID=1353775 RepID=A0ABP8Z1F6_9ACTN